MDIATSATGNADEKLRRWRNYLGALAVIQQLAMLAVFVLVFLFDESDRGLAYAAALAIALIEVVEWALAHEALRRNPGVSPEEIYASRPLDSKQRKLVVLNLCLVPALIPFLVVIASEAKMFGDSAWRAAILLFIAMLPGGLALFRVWRKNSWLAVSWLPAQPRKRTVAPTG